MDAGRDWFVLAPGIPTSPASQQPMVDTHFNWFDYHCLVEFRLSSPTEIPLHNYVDLSLPISTNNFAFLFGTDHNPYLFTFYGDFNLWAQNSPIINSSPDRFDPFETPINNFLLARISLFLLERKWFFQSTSIDFPNSSRYRSPFPSIILLLPAMD
jgi:hypothetical protein